MSGNSGHTRQFVSTMHPLPELPTSTKLSTIHETLKMFTGLSFVTNSILSDNRSMQRALYVISLYYEYRPTSKMQRLLSKFIDATMFVVQSACIAHCTFEYVTDLVVCSGPSMEPTLYSNNILVTEHVSPRLDKISRGDIIIAKCPTNPNQHICKRVVGLPGDRIRTGFTSQVVVPRGHVWLEGDNRSNSSDSRSYGPVPKGLIKSRAVFKIWPLTDATYLKD